MGLKKIRRVHFFFFFFTLNSPLSAALARTRQLKMSGGFESDRKRAQLRIKRLKVHRRNVSLLNVLEGG